MRSSFSSCSASRLDAIMGWMRGSLPGWEDGASWLLAPSGVVGSKKDMNRDHLRSNGHSNGHAAQVERHPKRVDYPRLLVLGQELLLAIGEDPDREGLRETPRRWADSWREFIEYDPGTTETTFASVSSEQLVCVSGIRVASLAAARATGRTDRR